MNTFALPVAMEEIAKEKEEEFIKPTSNEKREDWLSNINFINAFKQ